MPPLPKNKITRAEQGKRRHGNTPKLKKDPHSRIPLHKQGFMAQLMKFVGLDTSATPTPAVSKAESVKPEKADKKADKASVQPKSSGTKTGKVPSFKGKAPTKTIRQTQHKG